jgi:hypothetical protein
LSFKEINTILPKRVIGVLTVTMLSLLSYRVISSTVEKTNYLNNQKTTQTTTIVNVQNEKDENNKNDTKISIVNTEKDGNKQKGESQTDYYVNNDVQKVSLEKMNQITEQLGLSLEQQLNILRAYRNGKSIIAEDGTNFGLTLASIMGQESSYGTKLFNTKTFHKTKTSLGAFQIHLQTAREVIDEFSIMDGKDLNDNQLAYKLAHDFDFGAKIAGLYLKQNYEEAYNKSHKNPWRGAVSRYNGGWNNPTYITNIQDEMKVVKEFLKIMNIKS